MNRRKPVEELYVSPSNQHGNKDNQTENVFSYEVFKPFTLQKFEAKVMKRTKGTTQRE